jgi:hypothetical protein
VCYVCLPRFCANWRKIEAFSYYICLLHSGKDALRSVDSCGFTLAFFRFVLVTCLVRGIPDDETEEGRLSDGRTEYSGYRGFEAFVSWRIQWNNRRFIHRDDGLSRKYEKLSIHPTPCPGNIPWERTEDTERMHHEFFTLRPSLKLGKKCG